MHRFAIVFFLLVSLRGTLSSQDISYRAISPQQSFAILARDKPEDSVLIALFSLTEYYQRQDVDSSLYYAQLGVQRSEKLTQSPYRALAIHYLANALYYKDDKEAAIAWYRQAISLNHRLGKYQDKVSTLLAAGKSHLHLARFDSAKYYYEQANSLAKAKGFESSLASAYWHQAEYFGLLSELNLAVLYTDSLIQLTESLQDTLLQAQTLDMQGMIHLYQGNLQAAIQAFLQAKSLFEAQKQGYLLLGVETNLAHCLMSMGLIRESIDQYLIALERAYALPYPESQAFIQIQLATLYPLLGDEQKAAKYWQGVDSLREELNPYLRDLAFLELLEVAIQRKDAKTYRGLLDKNQIDTSLLAPEEALLWQTIQGQALFYFNREAEQAIQVLEKALVKARDIPGPSLKSRILLSLGDMYLYQSDIDRALVPLREVEELIGKYEIFGLAPRLYFLLLQAYQQMGDPLKAAQYLELYRGAMQSELSVHNALAIQMAEAAYGTRKIEQALAVSRQEIEAGERRIRQNQLLTLALSIMALLVIVVAFLLYRNNQSQRRHNTQLTLERDRNEVLLRELNHRVKNNLQHLSNLLQLQARQAQDIDVKAALKAGHTRVEAMALLHRQLYSGEEVHQLNLLDYLPTLVYELLRSYGYRPHEINLKLEVADLEVDIDQGISIGLIANEWIINSLKYAFETEAYLRLSLQLSEAGKVALIVEDRGPGFPEGFNWQQSDSYGLQLVRLMAEQLYGEVEVQSKPGLSWRLLFPLQTATK